MELHKLLDLNKDLKEIELDVVNCNLLLKRNYNTENYVEGKGFDEYINPDSKELIFANKWEIYRNALVYREFEEDDMELIFINASNISSYFTTFILTEGFYNRVMPDILKKLYKKEDIIGQPFITSFLDLGNKRLQCFTVVSDGYTFARWSYLNSSNEYVWSDFQSDIVNCFNKMNPVGTVLTAFDESAVPLIGRWEVDSNMNGRVFHGSLTSHTGLPDGSKETLGTHSVIVTADSIVPHTHEYVACFQGIMTEGNNFSPNTGGVYGAVDFKFWLIVYYIWTPLIKYHIDPYYDAKKFDYQGVSLVPPLKNPVTSVVVSSAPRHTVVRRWVRTS